MFETSWCWAPLANTPAPGIWAAPGSSSKIPNRNYEIPILLGVKIQLLGFQRPITMSWILCGIILWMAMWTQIWDLKGSLRWYTRMYKTAWISINANPHDIYIYISYIAFDSHVKYFRCLIIRSVSKMYACKHTSCCNVKDWEPLHPTRQSWRVKDPTSNFVSSRLCATCESSSGVSSLKSQEVQGAKNLGGFPQSWCKGKSCGVLTIDTPHIDTLLPGQDATKKTQWLAERGLWLSCGLLHPVQIFRIQQPWLSQANLQDFPSTTACSTSPGGIIFRSRANWETDIAKVWRFPTGWENWHRWAASSKLPKSRHFFFVPNSHHTW